MTRKKPSTADRALPDLTPPLAPGAYRLVRDVVNPHPDKRQTRDWRCAPVFSEGTLLFARTRVYPAPTRYMPRSESVIDVGGYFSESIPHRDGHGVYTALAANAVPVDVFADPAFGLALHANNGPDVFDAVDNALRACEPTSACRVAESILAALVHSGRIRMRDIAEAHAWREKQEAAANEDWRPWEPEEEDEARAEHAARAAQPLPYVLPSDAEGI